MERYFGCLSKMIEYQNLYNNNIENPLAELAKGGSLSKKDLICINNFVESKRPKIILRTRNFSKKAKVHNSNPGINRGIVNELIKKGAYVMNLGCPLFALGIKSDFYCEIDHNLTFDLELAFCQIADASMMSAQAGLFSAFAASWIKLIQFDDEWSMANLARPISLFESRKKIGMLDIDIRQQIEKNDYATAAEIILTKLKNSSKIVPAGYNRKPKIIEID